MRLEPKYIQRAQVHAEEKRRIGIAAAALVEDGDIIFVNSGMMTGGLLAALPPVLLSLIFQRYIVSGLTAGAVKG